MNLIHRLVPHTSRRGGDIKNPKHQTILGTMTLFLPGELHAGIIPIFAIG
jgi:hypothetical protein